MLLLLLGAGTATPPPADTRGTAGGADALLTQGGVEDAALSAGGSGDAALSGGGVSEE